MHYPLNSKLFTTDGGHNIKLLINNEVTLKLVRSLELSSDNKSMGI